MTPRNFGTHGSRSSPLSPPVGPEEALGELGVEIGERIAAKEGEVLSRLGTSAESAARLGRKAAEAEEKIEVDPQIRTGS